MVEDSPKREYLFRDISKKTRIVQVALALLALALFVETVFRLFEIGMLQDMADGAFPSQAEMMATATARDQRILMAVYAQLAAQIVLIITFCFWIYHASSNAHATSRIGLVISPGWAVGWFFIPFANFVMPYQAMREIWAASENPGNWKLETGNPKTEIGVFLFGGRCG